MRRGEGNAATAGTLINFVTPPINTNPGDRRLLLPDQPPYSLPCILDSYPDNQGKPPGGPDGMDALWLDPESTLTKGNTPLIPLYVTDDVRDPNPLNAYTNTIEDIDAEVGRLLDTLDEMALTDNTCVIFTSDNGPWLSFKHHGGSAALKKSATRRRVALLKNILCNPLPATATNDEERQGTETENGCIGGGLRDGGREGQ